jgi:hypothetical protein
MREDVESIMNHFHDRAAKMFFQLHHEYVSEIKQISRQKHENHFQQRQAQFVWQLKHRLQALAQEIIGQEQMDSNRNELRHALQNRVENYVQDFLLKLKDA